MTNRTVEILTKAAERIERDGLNKGGYFGGYSNEETDNLMNERMEEFLQGVRDRGETPSVDVFGALYFEVTDDRTLDLVIPFIKEAFGVTFTPQVVAIVDHPDTTQADVVAKLRKAAELAAA
jgi:hypothetical protein